MANLNDVIRFTYINYPNKQELSKARFTKLIYLIDWENAVEYGHQMTNINWLFNHYGPYVEDVVQEVSIDPFLKIVKEENYYGFTKELITFDKTADLKKISIDSLSENDKEIIIDVIETTSPFYWNNFINHVYSTLPVKNQVRYNHLDIIGNAKIVRDKTNSSSFE
ncbi:MAG: DUF4065 domain-containing protein [Calditrichaeota bacterium]|nr:MAG: DUF4065 domain-containing protein [Calditrichota bacterium]MBL1208049.1 DUF4065 domain-containing protein [Calditrichota bacterium]NOG47884.1 SocA family protein [Calditrichota bacterium]